jgi:hypothetical protein
MVGVEMEMSLEKPDSTADSPSPEQWFVFAVVVELECEMLYSSLKACIWLYVCSAVPSYPFCPLYSGFSIDTPKKAEIYTNCTTPISINISMSCEHTTYSACRLNNASSPVYTSVNMLIGVGNSHPGFN